MSAGSRYHLEGWAVVTLTGPYTSPENTQLALTGLRTNARTREAKLVTTSPIKTISGRTVTTASGSVYFLGKVAAAYHDWMREHGIPFNPARPITFASRAPNAPPSG